MAVYGHTPTDIPINETTEPRTVGPVDDYGLSKTLAEHIVRHYAHQHGILGIVLRLAAVHHPG